MPWLPAVKHRADHQARPGWSESVPSVSARALPPLTQEGLSSVEASARLQEYGPNRMRTGAQHPILIQFLSRFKNPLVLILLAASAVSAFTGEIANFVIITVMVLLSVTLDFVQDYRAGKAADKLKSAVAVRATVWRDGQRHEVPLDAIVPGDLLLLAAGDLIPADAWLVEARDFFLKEAALTGESVPVEKHAGALPDALAEPQATDHTIFAGTSVVSGSARAVVTRTGASTMLGTIGARLAHAPPPSAFENDARRFSVLIMRFTVLLVLFVLLMNALFHRPWMESFLFAVALAVGLTPELLPMVISVTLSRGAVRMAAKRVIVKRLAAIQDLGSMDILCTDKTGTLTEAKIRLEQHVDCAGEPSAHVLDLVYLNSFFETGLKSPLDDAVLQHDHLDIGTWTKVDEVPFDFERRRVSVLLDNGQARLLIVKGAPGDILPLCRSYEARGVLLTLPEDKRTVQNAQGCYQALERQGFRVLGVAWREVPRDYSHAAVSDEAQLSLAGFAAFLDPPKQSSAAALAALAASGVAIKIVTGDSELVTAHICEQLRIPISGIVLGADIEALDSAALLIRVQGANLFCRMNPLQKERVIRALKACGHVVGYLGDGINDAPSLHAADVGISVDCGVDVAKAAADIILLENDLQVLRDGVMEGRRTFANCTKYMMMATSSNFGNMFSMAGASVLLPFLPMLPTQILLNNVLYDLSEVAIPMDNVDADDMRVPRVLDIGFIRNFMLVIGPVSSLFDLLTFYILLRVLEANEALFQTGWFVESLLTQVLVIFVLRTRGNPFASRTHPLLIATSLTAAVCALVLPMTPLAPLFGFVPLPGSFYMAVVALVIAYLVCVEGAKRLFYRRYALNASLAPLRP